MHFLRHYFTKCLISLCGDVESPPRSTCDYFLKAYLKGPAFVDKPRTLETLVETIMRQILRITHYITVERTIEDWANRLQECFEK